MKCPECGKEIESWVIDCPECGKRVGGLKPDGTPKEWAEIIEAPGVQEFLRQDTQKEAYASKKAGDYAKASECFEKLICFPHPDAEHFFELFDLYTGIGEKENAERIVRLMKPYVSEEIYIDYKSTLESME